MQRMHKTGETSDTCIFIFFAITAIAVIAAITAISATAARLLLSLPSLCWWKPIPNHHNIKEGWEISIVLLSPNLCPAFPSPPLIGTHGFNTWLQKTGETPDTPIVNIFCHCCLHCDHYHHCCCCIPCYCCRHCHCFVDVIATVSANEAATDVATVTTIAAVAAIAAVTGLQDKHSIFKASVFKWISSNISTNYVKSNILTPRHNLEQWHTPIPNQHNVKEGWENSIVSFPTLCRAFPSPPLIGRHGFKTWLQKTGET